jgi:membrane dipeptidase
MARKLEKPVLLLGALVLVVVAAIIGWRLAGKSAAPKKETPGRKAEQPAAGSPAEELARRLLIVDSHIDLPYRMVEEGGFNDDISQRTAKGDFDAVRARSGGLDVAWMSIYVPSKYQKGDGAKAYADQLIDLVRAQAAKHPWVFGVATSADEAEQVAHSGRIALAMGMENGAGIEGDLANLQHFYRRGIRYVTLVHDQDNLIGDSSYSDRATRKWHGLSAFGKKAVAEMNRLGIMVDLSHVSDETFDAALALSKAPPIASHSSCRSFTPGFERNLDDGRIRALAAKGGVIQINFGSAFLTQAANEWMQQQKDAEEKFVRETNAKEATAELDDFKAQWVKDHPLPRATIDDVVAHIEHVVGMVGVDHVGLGSDFDGVGPTLPTELADVSMYPNLIAKFLERGYDEEAIAKILGGNLMRVWREAERVSAELQGTSKPATADPNAPADIAPEAPTGPPS